MKAAIEMVLRQNLKELKRSTMLSWLAEQLRQANETHQRYEEFLLGFTETALQVRAQNRLKRRLREAKFPLMKPLEEFTFDRAVGLDARQIRRLWSCESIEQHRNGIFLGNSGTGKTHLATSLGIEAWKQGFRTRVVTGCGLANKLLEAREERSLSRLMKRYAGRHERKSVMVTSNLGFADWPQSFGEANLTAALLDRLTYQAAIITCSWESYRLHKTLEQRVTKPNKHRQSESTSALNGTKNERGDGESDPEAGR